MIEPIIGQTGAWLTVDQSKGSPVPVARVIFLGWTKANPGKRGGGERATRPVAAL